MAALYRRLHLLRRLPRSQPHLLPSAPTNPASALLLPSRRFSFASAEEAAAERRRRKRQLRIEPPLHAVQRRDPSSRPRPPPRDPNAPRLPDTTSALVGPRLSLHNRVQSLIRSGDLDGAAASARAALSTRVRPTVFTCNAVAAAMGRAGRHGDAVDLFDAFFRRSGVVPNVVSYNTLILAHCEAGRVDEALQAYQEMLDGVTSFSPSAVSYRHLTKGLVAAGRIQDALELLHSMFHRGQGADSIVYKNLIDGYIGLDNWDKAFELFDELREKAADGVVHTSFMEGYWKKGMDKEAMENYKSLLDRNFRMTPATCNVLLETLFKHDKHTEANDLWEAMIDNHTPPSFIGMNSESYNVMVNQCFKDGKFHEAIEVFHRQPRRNVQMDVGCFNNIIGKLCENGMFAEAGKLFEEMESRSVLPDVYTYTYMVDSCFKQEGSRVDDALQYFYKMADGREHGPKFNIGFFNRMFEGLSEAGRIEDALKVYGRMSDKEIRPNTTTFEILVKALCKGGELDRALDLVRDMARCAIVAPPEFRESVTEIFKNVDRQEEIEKAFDEKPVPLPLQPKPEVRTHSAPQGLSGFASNQKTQGSYTPQQGQPFQPRNDASQVRQTEWMSPKPQQPVFTNQEVKKEEVAPSNKWQHGLPSQALPQDQQPEFGTSRPWQQAVSASQVQQPYIGSAQPVQPVFSTGPQQPGYGTQHPGFGTSRQWQAAYGTHQAQQTGHGAHQSQHSDHSAHQAQQLDHGAHQAQQLDHGAHQAQQPGYAAQQAHQPGYGAQQAQQPGYGAQQAQQPEYGAHQAQQPRYGDHQAQQLGHGTHQPSQPLFGASEAPQSSLGSAQSLARYGRTGNEHDQLGSHQGATFGARTQQDFSVQPLDDMAVKYSQRH